jgi:hypothetical protein
MSLFNLYLAPLHQSTLSLLVRAEELVRKQEGLQGILEIKDTHRPRDLR